MLVIITNMVVGLIILLLLVMVIIITITSGDERAHNRLHPDRHSRQPGS